MSFVFMIGCNSFHFFDVRKHPRLIEVRLCRPVEAEVGEPSLVWQRLDPVLGRFASGCLGPEIKIDGTVRVLGDVITRRTIGITASVNEAAAFVVVDGKGPELRDWRVLRNGKLVSLPPIEPRADAVLLRFEINLARPNCAAHHPDSDPHSLIEPRRTFVELRIIRFLLIYFCKEKRVFPLSPGPHDRA